MPAATCARCGEKRRNGGFRFFIRGVAYCDTCWGWAMQIILDDQRVLR